MVDLIPLMKAHCPTIYSRMTRCVLLAGLAMTLSHCGSGGSSSSSRYTAVGNFDESGRSRASRAQLVSATQTTGGSPSVNLLWDRCHHLSKQRLRYDFGSDSPYNGGMDCSGTVQFVVKSLGYHDVPRASYQQYQWMKDMGCLKEVGMWHSEERAYASLKPGDLVFWGGTYRSGHKVSHVEIYMGKNPQSGQQFTFGARSSRSKGLNGNGVDVFQLSKRKKGQLVGYGTLPGLRR